MGKRTVIFRADGGPSIGMGHFIRSLALVEMLSEDFQCVFVTRKPTGYQIEEIEKVCHSRIDLPEDDDHFERFLSLLKGNEIVVLDNYYFDTDYQRAIKEKGCKLVCIDDVHDKHYVADIVINHAEGISPEHYSVEPYAKLLLGYKYALIRKDFREVAKEFQKKKYSCLIMMGGADPFGMTSQILEILQEFEFDRPIAIVNGTANQTNVSNTKNKLIFFEKMSAGEVAELMRNSDFGIFPASTVAIEACASRLPFICGYFIENQLEIYKSLEEKQLAMCVGDFRKISSEELLKATEAICNNKLRKSIIQRQIRYLDNESKRRLIKEFRQL